MPPTQTLHSCVATAAVLSMKKKHSINLIITVTKIIWISCKITWQSQRSHGNHAYSNSRGLNDRSDHGCSNDGHSNDGHLMIVIDGDAQSTVSMKITTVVAVIL